MSEIDRRSFSAALAASLSGAWPAAARAADGAPAPAGGLTDVGGLSVGHFTDSRRPTGCTVVLAEAGAVCGVDVRGGAPGTRETDLLNPINTVEQVHGIVLSGGSAFGLDTATGVMRYLEEKGVGVPWGSAKIPIVPAAILFDLGIGDWKIRPDANAGYAAARAASSGRVAEGCVGAGAGAACGFLHGMERAMKSGIGTASLKLPNGAIVAALVAANPFGDVVDPETGRPIAGLRSEDGKALRGTVAALLAGETRGAPQVGREHRDRRRGHERRTDEERGEPRGRDGPRRLLAVDPPGAHARRRRHALRALDGRRPARASGTPRRYGRGRGRRARRRSRRAHGHEPAGTALRFGSRETLSAGAVHGLRKSRRSSCGFPVALLCVRGERLWKARGSSVENRGGGCGKAARGRGKVALRRGKPCAFAAEKRPDCVDDLWMSCGKR